MAAKPFDSSKLQAFGNAAAGHDGVLSDESGAVVVKPCTAAEIGFYETVVSSHSDLLPHLPIFLGQLSLDSPADASEDTGIIETADGTTERLHGKKLATDLHVVLENITHGFKKPNVLDLKLGAQLWDDDAKPDKRARLDKVSAETTSGSLGFRIAGMRTWLGAAPPEVPEDLAQYVEQDKESGYWVYNKMYGRKFSAEGIDEGFKAFFPQGTEAEKARAREVLAYFLGEVKDIQEAFEAKESRMYSASILLVYEGDVEEYENTKKVLRSARPESEEDEDEDEAVPKLAAVKMIDFAHATFTPGQGPDENALKGMRSTATILKRLLDSAEKDA
ncbi:inositol hexaphosphate kinase 3 [Didymella exigua CBS 183.55]|uniref:Kinase n=1 Tax=Didymella exigua CBS 183.55 TaxID=1150837 RepID=A0A6A5R9T7_9PLEO|nr:inositol hexaphosphate kinase 3 [Didymella exigua CBS 183.55]KAF1924283.1 inositol hexaphosphate kinase 3 [Didymella exigua CBS 183.55]